MLSSLLESGGLSPIQKRTAKTHRPKLGQHFLHDARYRARILDALPLDRDDVVLEIGPGGGAMTGLLTERARRIIAIEVDPSLAEKLKVDFLQQSQVEVRVEDILRTDLAAICQKEGVPQVFVFGNLPYYITSPIIHHLLAQRKCIRAMGLLVQREVANRLTAMPGTRDYGYLTIATQMYMQPQMALHIPPGAFSPPPQVQSALVTFRMEARFPQWPPGKQDQFLDFVKGCFAQKRKNLPNNLGGSYPRHEIAKALEQIAKPSTSRAEQLSLHELAEVFAFLIRAHHAADASKAT